MLKLAKTSTFTRNVNVQLPTDKPNDFNTGTLAVRYKLKSKAEYLDLFDKGLSDVEFFDQVVDGVDGLGDAGGQAISGEPALNECRSGPWSNHLLHAIVSDYVDQWSDARVKKLQAVARALSGKPPRDEGGDSQPAEEPVTTADFLRGGTEEPASGALVLEVFEDNWDTVQVFMQCKPTYLQGGLGRPAYLGISALELEASARLCGVPRRSYDTLRAGVRVMAETTGEIWNAKR